MVDEAQLTATPNKINNSMDLQTGRMGRLVLIVTRNLHHSRRTDGVGRICVKRLLFLG